MFTRLLRSVDNWLLRAGAGCLLIVAVLKVLSALSGVEYLTSQDPLFPFLTNKEMLFLAANAEFICASLMAVRPETLYARYGLLALCATFVLYRLGLAALDVRPACPCLGRASDWLGITPRQSDELAFSILLVLLAIAVTSLFASWRRAKANMVVIQ